jgi:hypothetical protein
MILTGGNQNTRREAGPRATLSTTNLTWTDLGLKVGLGSDKPATNRLNNSTAHEISST